MLNNAIEHSEGKRVYVRAMKNAYAVSCVISDNGIGYSQGSKHIGIIRKAIRDIRASKGKFTSDPDSHTARDILFFKSGRRIRDII